MKYFKINEHLTKANTSELKLDMIKPYNEKLSSFDFFMEFIRFILDYNSNHMDDSFYFADRELIVPVRILKNISTNKLNGKIKVNEVIQLYKNKLFRNIKNDIDNRIVVLYVEYDKSFSFYILISKFFSKKFKKKYKGNLSDKHNSDYIKNEDKYSNIESLIKSYLRYQDVLNINSEFLFIDDDISLENLISELMINEKYKILNYDFHNFSNIESNIENKNLIDSNFYLYNKEILLETLNGISFNDIINKDKEKITFIDEKEYKKLVIKESFK
ncbi:hypothetical protein [Staphylococcus phage LY01]|nr:hypothetical protein [Staphylococcus phage LY01]